MQDLERGLSASQEWFHYYIFPLPRVRWLDLTHTPQLSHL